MVNTLYYPSFTKDTLNNQPITRQYYMISVYDEDTNKDKMIDKNDLRRFYYFDVNAGRQKALIPKNYSVMSSEYDSENDLMYVFARQDNNENGQMESKEPIHVFWIHLNNPDNKGMLYKN